VEPMEVQPFPLDDPTLRKNFCVAIDVAEDSLSTCPNLLALFTLCGGRPNLVDIVIQVIKDRRQVSTLTLPSIPVNEAEDVFTEAIQEASITYGIGRWHSLFGGLENPPEGIRNRESFHHVTCRLIRRLLLDAYVNRYIDDLTTLIVQPSTDPALQYLEKRYPRYESCVTNGMFAMPDNIVRIPLMVLLVMDRIVNVLPHKSLKSPFDPNWGYAGGGWDDCHLLTPALRKQPRDTEDEAEGFTSRCRLEWMR